MVYKSKRDQKCSRKLIKKILSRIVYTHLIFSPIGEIAAADVNVSKDFEYGQSQLKRFQGKFTKMF